MTELCLIFGEELLLYSFGPGHPMRSDRITSFWKELEKSGLLRDREIEVCNPVMAKREDLLLFHDEEYVRFVEEASRRGIGVLDYGDTPAFSGVFEASCYVVGSTLLGLEKVMRKDALHAFNPMGGLHHARKNAAGGFCVFNDVAIAISKALRDYCVEKLLYVDLDAHHGDGVLYGFYDDPRVYIADVHESGRFLYPGTGFREEKGKGKAEGTKLNIPLNPGDGDEELLLAIEEVRSFARKVKPDIIIIQCGADGLSSDPLTHLRYSHEGHRLAVQAIHELAHELCEGRLVATGGGGYNRKDTAIAWVNVVDVLTSCK